MFQRVSLIIRANQLLIQLGSNATAGLIGLGLVLFLIDLFRSEGKVNILAHFNHFCFVLLVKMYHFYSVVVATVLISISMLH